MEQYLRDSRILHPIHEGTTGIQAQDLLGRKVVIENGQAMTLYLEEVSGAIQLQETYETLRPYAERLSQAADDLQSVTMSLVQVALKGDIERYLADATLYLEFFGIIAVAWQWLVQGVAAEKALQKNATDASKLFYRGKIETLRYSFSL